MDRPKRTTFAQKTIMFGSFNLNLAGSCENPLQDALRNGAMLVDVRTPDEFAAGSANGALNIPLQILPAKLDLLPKSRQIVVFCRSGMRSAEAKRYLDQQGYRNVINGRTWQDVAHALDFKSNCCN